MKMTTSLKLIFSTLVFLFSMSYACAKTKPTPPLNQPVQALLGKWHGFMYCTNMNYNFSLTINSSQGNRLKAKLTSSLHSYINGKKSRGGAYPRTLEIDLVGEYSNNQSFFILQSTTNQRERKLILKALLDPTAPRFSAEIEMPYYGQCSLAIAGKKSFKKTLKKIDKASRFVAKLFGRPKGTDSCDGAMKKWLEATESLTAYSIKNYRDPALKGRNKYTAFEMLQDKYFKPYFGKSFLSISENKMSKFYHQLANGCSRQLRSGSTKHRVLLKISQLAQNTKELTRSELAMYPYTKQILSNWKRSSVIDLASTSAIAQQKLSATAEYMLRPLWPSENGNIKDEIVDSVQIASGEKMLAQLKIMLTERPMSFQKLAAISEFSTTTIPSQSAQSSYDSLSVKQKQQRKKSRRTRGRSNARAAALAKKVEQNAGVSAQSQQQAEEMIKQTINKLTVEAADYFAKSITKPTAIITHLNPLRKGKYSAFLKYLEPEKAQKVNDIFAKRKALLIESFVKWEQDDYNRLSQTNVNISSLRSFNHFEKGLHSKYSTLLNSSQFAQFNQLRKATRVKQIKGNLNPIKLAFKNSENLTLLDYNFENLLLDKDKNTPIGSQITAFYNIHRKRVAPFLDFPGGDYLDAIYRGDYASLRNQDRRYGKMISNQFDKAMTGLAPGTPNPYSMKGLVNSFTLIKPISAVYLFNYQTVYQRCLKDDRVVFVVTRTVPDIVTTNILGWEVSRSYGYSTSTDYKINKEFTLLFRIVGTSKPFSFSSGFVDSFLGGGKKNKVLRGIKMAMRSLDCNSKQVKQFEANLRSYASRLKR